MSHHDKFRVRCDSTPERQELTASQLFKSFVADSKSLMTILHGISVTRKMLQRRTDSLLLQALYFP